MFLFSCYTHSTILRLVCMGSFWVLEGFFSRMEGLVLVSVVVSWFGLGVLVLVFLLFWFWFFVGSRPSPPPRKKKKGGGDKETTMGLFIFNSEVGWIPGQDLVLHKVEHECLGLLTPLEIKPTSSLVWQCNTKYPKQRLLFSILSTQCIQCYHVIYFKCAMICVMSWH